jgi:hypothetical protein
MYGGVEVSSTIIDLGSRWRWVLTFMHCHLSPRETAPGTHCIGGWVALIAGLETWRKKKKSLSPNRNQTTISQPSSPYPIAIPTELSQLLICVKPE